VSSVVSVDTGAALPDEGAEQAVGHWLFWAKSSVSWAQAPAFGRAFCGCGKRLAMADSLELRGKRRTTRIIRPGLERMASESNAGAWNGKTAAIDSLEPLPPSSSCSQASLL
jgi:hypothetical protein